jgi:hypothetical protein
VHQPDVPGWEPQTRAGSWEPPVLEEWQQTEILDDAIESLEMATYVARHSANKAAVLSAPLGRFEGSLITAGELDPRQEAWVVDYLESLRRDVAVDAAAVAALDRTLFQVQHLNIGKIAPEIAGEDLDEVEFKLSDYRGKVVVLAFWGDW